MPDTLVIFGADFSLEKIVTKHDYNPQEVLQIDLPKVNSEMVKISQSYIINFQANHLLFDSIDVTRMNASIKTVHLFTDKRFTFSAGDSIVRTVLKNYNTKGYKNGAGLLFVMEKVDEIADRESFYILMFDLNTKKIIHCDKIETGLSRVKNKFPSGWFSWKTGINKTLEEMDHVYDFWNSYPEDRPIDIRSDAPDQAKNNTPLASKKEDKSMGIKNKKMTTINGALTNFETNLEPKYRQAFLTDPPNNYGVTGFYVNPKFNIAFDYGMSKKISIGFLAGYEKSFLIWGDTLYNTGKNTDTWKRFQIAVKANYYFISLPKVSLSIGPQLAYNILKASSTSRIDYTPLIEPLPITGQLNFNFAYYFKGLIGINAGIGLGFGSCDIFTIGICGKF
jgi:hypothetical protein